MTFRFGVLGGWLAALVALLLASSACGDKPSSDAAPQQQETGERASPVAATAAPASTASTATPAGGAPRRAEQAKSKAVDLQGLALRLTSSRLYAVRPDQVVRYFHELAPLTSKGPDSEGLWIFKGTEPATGLAARLLYQQEMSGDWALGEVLIGLKPRAGQSADGLYQQVVDAFKVKLGKPSYQSGAEGNGAMVGWIKGDAFEVNVRPATAADGHVQGLAVPDNGALPLVLVTAANVAGHGEAP